MRMNEYSNNATVILDEMKEDTSNIRHYLFQPNRRIIIQHIIIQDIAAFLKKGLVLILLEHVSGRERWKELIYYFYQRSD